MSQNPWVGLFFIGRGEAYGCSLSPMLVCGSFGIIMLHSKHNQTTIAKHIRREDMASLPERVDVRDVNEILGILSGYQTVLHDRRSEDRGHSRRDQYNQSGGGSQEAGHDSGVLDSWAVAFKGDGSSGQSTEEQHSQNPTGVL